MEFMVRMRDGVELYTLVYLPSGSVMKRASVLIRTPYGTNTLENECASWADNENFNCVMQDFRGRYKSQGSFEFFLNASTDAYDTMAWLTAQTWSDGKTVFTTGASANGIAQYLQPISKPPWLKAQFVTVGSAQIHHTTFQQGAYRESLTNGWLTAINEASFIPIIVAHEAYSSFWENSTLNQWQNVDAPSIHLAGWYDIFSQPQLTAFMGYQTMSSPPSLGNNYLVVLPTGHCSGGQIKWSNVTFGLEFATHLAVALFNSLAASPKFDENADSAVRDDLITSIDDRKTTKTTNKQINAIISRPSHPNPQPQPPPQPQTRQSLSFIPHIIWYVMGPGTPGSLGNYWTAADQWPSTRSLALYLVGDGGGGLSPEPPTNSNGGNKSFIYDPKNPVPTLGGNNLLLPKCGPWDQTPVENRADVLTFTSAPLTNALAVTGHISAVLYVSSNATDTDFTVKVTDVFPGGADAPSMLLQDGIIRMRWRNDNRVPNLMKPGQVYKVTVDIWSTSYIFNAGHRIRVDISSSNYPRFSANPNNGLPLARRGPLITALNTVYADRLRPSHLLLPVVSMDSLSPANLSELRQWILS